LTFGLVSYGNPSLPNPDGAMSDEPAWVDQFGAISYSPSTGAYGRSWNWSTRERAEDVANGYCAQADCRVVVWVRNGCAALAVAQGDRGLWGWAWSSSRSEAESLALAECHQDHGPCMVKTSVCTD